MSKIVQQLRGTTTEMDAVTHPSGVITIDTQRNEIRLHDGETPGGIRVANLEALKALFVSKLEGLGSDVGFPESGGGIIVRLNVDDTYVVRTLQEGEGISIDVPDGSTDDPEIGVDVDWLSAVNAALRGSVAEVRAGVAAKTIPIDDGFAAGGYVALAHADPVVVDFSTGWNFTLEITGSTTLGNPTNLKVQSGVIELTAVGSDRVLSLGSNWVDPGIAFPVTLSEGTTFYISYFVDATNQPVVSGVIGI